MVEPQNKKRKTSEKKKKSDSKKPTDSIQPGITQNGESKMNGSDAPKKKTETKPLRIRDDVEFAPDDYEGRIARYRQRIAEGHSKFTYETMIKELEEEKKTREAVMKQYPGKSWPVIERLGALELIEDHLVRIKDPCGELKNVRAVIAAYQSGELEVNGKATYWGQGKMVGGPSVFMMEDFRRYNTAENRGDGALWVEGMFKSQKPPKKMAITYVGPPTSGIGEAPKFDLSLRLDQTIKTTAHDGEPYPELTVRFLDDTGCELMTINDGDMRALMGHDATPDMPAPPLHLMGYNVVELADASKGIEKTIAVEVNMEGTNPTTGAEEDMVDPWTSVPCLVNDPGIRAERLAGPWPRTMLYVASAPEFPSHFYASTTKSGVMRDLPSVPVKDRVELEFARPTYGVRWVWDAQKNKWSIPRTNQAGQVPARHAGG
ncbi:hypothetical protein N7488_007069 [Penicillium malachiteum]|nr:hypothetical protein N7488_007069 [Penicillium malachiteum]